MESIKKVEATILLDYIFNNIKPDFCKIFIDKNEYQLEKVDKKEINIKFNDIEAELEHKTIELGFLNKYNEKEIFQCEIIPGINNGILFPFIGPLRDIILPDNKNYRLNIAKPFELIVDTEKFEREKKIQSEIQASISAADENRPDPRPEEDKAYFRVSSLF